MSLQSRATEKVASKAKGTGTVTLKSKLQRFNFSPKGGIEGLILEDGDGFLQVTVPPELGGTLLASMVVGKPVQLTAVAEPDSHGDHPVYKMVQLHGKDGLALDTEGRQSVKGKVAALNFAKHGEANGVILDSGEFLHLKPDGMEKLGLMIGDKVAASGSARSHVLGGLVIEVEEINGHKLGKKKPPH